MKNIYIYLCASSFLLSSCFSLVHYVGETFPPTSSVDVYYHVKDITKEYTVVGRMTREMSLSGREQKEMINEARRRGAHGIIFYDLDMEAGKTSVVVAKAELIRYK